MISHLIKSSLAGTLTVQYRSKHPFMFLRMDQPLMYFSTKKLIRIKNVMLDAIRDLREFRLDWRTFKPSSSQKMSVQVSHNLDGLIKPIKWYKDLPYYVNLSPKQANAFVRDIKNVILEIRLRQKNG